VAIAPGIHLTKPTDGENPSRTDRESGGRRPARVEGVDAAVQEDRGRGYFIQPFSR
jgi:hypothetical protein